MAVQELIKDCLIAFVFEREKKWLYHSSLVILTVFLLLSWVSFIKMTYAVIYPALLWPRHLLAPYITLDDFLTICSYTASSLCYLSAFLALCLGLVLKICVVFFIIYLGSFQRTYLLKQKSRDFLFSVMDFCNISWPDAKVMLKFIYLFIY